MGHSVYSQLRELTRVKYSHKHQELTKYVRQIRTVLCRNDWMSRNIKKIQIKFCNGIEYHNNNNNNNVTTKGT